MTSGIYLLTFSSGNTYIGKSVNIENRWKQHGDKFKKGVAASAMQLEFNRCGTPKSEILFKCHADHVDIVEACFINRLKPTLNGTYPPDPFFGIHDNVYDDLMGMLHLSTVEHVDYLIRLNSVCSDNRSKVTSLTEQVTLLMLKRTKEELKADVNKRIDSYIDCIEEREAEIEKLIEDNKVLREKLIPWWKKMFA